MMSGCSTSLFCRSEAPRTFYEHLTIYEHLKKFETAAELEGRLAQKVMETVWEQMTEAQQTEMEQDLADLADKQGKKKQWAQAGGLAGTIVAAELGGFATYILATSGLSALVGLFGVVLPFGVYTALTSTMGVILGPVGWIGAGLFGIWKISGPNYKKLVPGILYISMLRHRQEAEA